MQLASWVCRANYCRSLLPKSTPHARRGYAAAAHAAGSGHQQDPSKIRNLALVAHIDSGKTTLTESILLKSGYVASPGTVDTGSTTTDFLPAERERGITIQSASIPVKWKDWNFNLVDTPGHADFGMEVECASRVVDGAVVLIDSVEGVESQTKGVWRQLDRYGVPTRMIFLNKLDRPGASFRSSIQSLLAHGLHPRPTALTLPIASFNPRAYSQAEPGIEGIIDLVKWEMWKWDAEGNFDVSTLPRDPEGLATSNIFPEDHPVLDAVLPARTQLLESLSMHSEELMDTLLSSEGDSSYLSLDSSDIIPHLRSATLKNEILPVFCGSAMKHIGTDLLMDYMGELLACPLDIKHEAQVRNTPTQLLAWKVAWDKRQGWMTFVRVYSGTLKRGDTIYNATRNTKERVMKVLLLYANRTEEVDELPFGSVGVILGLKNTRTGDTLVSSAKVKGKSGTSLLVDIVPPPAVISASVIPRSFADLAPVQEALLQLERTDPSVRVDLEHREGQILVHGLGALHLEIVERRLRDEWNAQFEFGQRRVSYREGLGSKVPEGVVTHTWKPESGSAPVAVTMSLSLRPLKEDEQSDSFWNGNVVVDATGLPLHPGDSASKEPSTYIASGLATVLNNSPHTSLSLTGARIQIKAYEFPAGASPSLLAGASASILRGLIRTAGMGPILEPYVFLKTSVEENTLGKVIKDLTEHGGEIQDLGDGVSVEEFGGYKADGVYIPPSSLSPSASGSAGSVNAPRLRRTVQGVAPLSRQLDYSQRLRALSGGYGTFEMTNAGFREVSDIRKMEILKEIGRA
ncbi:Tr-type G domain-containing protein [Pleurotus pulmonarius]